MVGPQEAVSPESFDGMSCSDNIVFNLEKPALEEHTLPVIPDITVDGSGQFQEIRWSYQNLKGEPCSLPSGITELSIWLNPELLT